jgi:hypothetical protein
MPNRNHHEHGDVNQGAGAILQERGYFIEYEEGYGHEIENPPARKSNRELDRLMQILDEIAVEKLRNENYEERGSQ